MVHTTRAVLRSALVLFALQAWLASEPAFAQAPALHWTRSKDAGECIDPSSLADRVEQLTGPVIVRPADAERSIEGHIARRPEGGYRVRLSVSDVRSKLGGERLIEHAADDCRAFDPAIILVVALMIAPELSLSSLPPELVAMLSSEIPAEDRLVQEERDPPEPEPAADVLALEPAQPEATVASQSVDAPTPERTTKFLLGLSAVGELSTMPKPLFGAAMTFERSLHGVWSLLASVRGVSSAGSFTLDTSPPEEAKARAVDVMMATCAGTSADPSLRVALCGGAEYSLWLMKNVSLARAQTASLSGLGASLTLLLHYRLSSRLSLGAFATLRANLLNRAFSAGNDAIAHRIPAVSAILGIAPEWSF